MNNKLDQVYVINLDMAKDRWGKVTKNLNDNNINHSRFSATNGYKVKITSLKTGETFFGQDIKDKKTQLNKYEKYKITCDSEQDQLTEFVFKGYINFLGNTISAGELGYWCSYIRVFKDAKDKGYNKIIIFEDDIYIKQDLNNFILHLPQDTDLAYLGSHVIEREQSVVKVNSYVDGFKGQTTGWGSYAMLLTSTGIDRLLSIEEYSYPLDKFLWCVSTGNIRMQPYHNNSECDEYTYNPLVMYTSSTELVGVMILNDEISINVMGREF